MKYLFALALFELTRLSAVCSGADGTAASISRAIQQSGLDPGECYRVRDLAFQKEDIKIYLNEGHLIFAKPVEGRRLAAVYVGDVPGGDAELMVFPPQSSERRSLAVFTKSPNLNEHFMAAVFIFSDNTAVELQDMLKDAKKEPDSGLVLAGQFDSVVRNIATSYEIRLVHDLLSADWQREGVFFAAVSGKTLGNFDVLYDPRARDQVMVGQLVFNENRRFFDTWASFRSRSIRNGSRTPPQDPFAFRNFVIDASLDPDLTLKAKTRVEVVAKSASSRVVVFDLSRRMKVTDVRIDGEPVEYFARESLRSNLVRNAENEAFMVILPKPLAAGGTRTLEISHEGAVISSSGNGVYYVAARNNWYPGHDGVFATYDITFRYPKRLQLVSTGEVVEDRSELETRITRRKVNSPIRFAGFNLGDYEKASGVRAGFTIEVYANRKIEPALQRQREYVPAPPPMPGRIGRRQAPDLLALPIVTPVPDPKLRLAALADEIGSAMEFMSSHFGPPPLKTLTVSPIPGAFGQGFPGLLYLSTLAYLNPNELAIPVRTDSQRRFFTDLLHAHEVAHQWWGNLVASASHQDDWLMEALANYSALMFLEKKKGRKALEEVLDEYRQHLIAEGTDGKTVESSGPIVWGTRLNSSQASNYWRVIVYEKGAWIVHMVRVRLGDAAFLKMLNALAQRNRYSRVSTETFQKLAAEFSPAGSDDAKFESFFEQWVYGTGIPQLKLSHSVRGKAPRVRVTGSIAQTGVDEEFSATVPVEMQLPGKKSSTKWVRTSSEPISFASDLPQPPVRVAIDPYAVLIRR